MKKFTYRFNNLISRGPKALMVILVSLTMVVVLILGSLAFLIENNEMSYPVTLWYTFNHIVDPGYLFGQGTENFEFLFLMTIATFWGILVYSLVISFVSTALLKKLEDLRLGRSLVVEENHTLILDYNRTVPTMIEELVASRFDKKKLVIVILANMDPADIYLRLNPMIKHHPHLRLIVRKGDPTHLQDLNMVGIATAASFIIASLEDIVTIKTLLAIKQTTFFENKESFGVCTIQNEKNLDIAHDLSNKQIYVLYLSELKSKVLARTCLHPGLSSVYKNIFSFEGEEVRFVSLPSLIGKTFQYAIDHLDHGFAIGIKQDGRVDLNPPRSIVLGNEDELIVLVTDHRKLTFKDLRIDDVSALINHDPYIHSGRRVLLIGFNLELLKTIEEMEKYVGKNSSLTMLVATEADQARLAKAYPVSKFSSFSIVVGETFSREVLEQFDYQHIDTVGVFTNQFGPQTVFDSESLLTLLHLEQITDKLGKKPSIVVEIEDPANIDSVSQVGIDDFLVSDELFSKMMTQICMNPKIYPVLEELISETGQEFYLRRASGYLPSNQSFSIQAYMQAASSKNQLFVGYKKHKENIVLNPDKETLLTLGPLDRIIILAEF